MNKTTGLIKAHGNDCSFYIEKYRSTSGRKMEKVSANMQDYLVAIVALTSLHGHAHTRDIARMLHVKMPSVTYALKTLSRKKFLLYSPSAPVILTESGKKLGMHLYQCRMTIKDFFEKVLYLPPVRAMEFACMLEHRMDKRSLEAFHFLTAAIEERPDCRTLKKDLKDCLFLERKLVETNKTKDCKIQESVQEESFNRSVSIDG